jgi:hypothetical protein
MVSRSTHSSSSRRGPTRCIVIQAFHQAGSNDLWQGFNNLISRILRLSQLHPATINITWGAGGSTKERSLELATLTQEAYGIDTALHLTCTNLEHGTVEDVLRVRIALC